MITIWYIFSLNSNEIHVGIQNNDDAAMYAQMALKQNHFDKEVRTSLCKWSPEHAKRVQQEEHSVFVIESAWRHR